MNVPDLSPYGPHSPDYTRHVGATFAEAVRVLNHATASEQGIANPADVYDLLGQLKVGVAGLDQTTAQLARCLEDQLRADILAVASGPYAGNPRGAVAVAVQHLSVAPVAVRQLARALERAQQAISAVSAAADDDQT